MTTETTNLWLDNKNSNIVRVLYVSNTGWSRTMMADIDLHNEKVDLIIGTDSKGRKPISEFMYSQPGSFRRLSFTGCDFNIIKHTEEVIKKVIEENKENAYDYYINLKNHVEAVLYNNS